LFMLVCMWNYIPFRTEQENVLACRCSDTRDFQDLPSKSSLFFKEFWW
jgi:hypothetical protein